MTAKPKDAVLPPRITNPRRIRPVSSLPEPSTPATVSVIIPCYNYGRYLSEAVHSALSQEGVDVQVIIVDDASSDDSMAIAASLAHADARVVVSSNETNSGPVVTFNHGIDRASGEFLVRLDADDLLTPGSLRRSVDVMRAYPSVGLVYGHPLHFAGERRPSPRAIPTRWALWPGQEWLAARCKSGQSVITAPEVLMRSGVVHRVGGQQPLPHAHDFEMWMRIAAFSDVAYIEGVDQAWHREHAGSLSTQLTGAVADYRERKAAFDALFTGIVAETVGADEFWMTARSTLARAALEDACHSLERGRTDVAVAEFVDFAAECVDDVTGLPEWARLRKRQGAISGRVLKPWYWLCAARRSMQCRQARRRWSRRGVHERG